MKTDLTPRRIRVAVVTCYFMPDYVRSLSVRAALRSLEDVETIILKNSTTGLLRYPEVVIKLLWSRITKHPDVYILEFRGQEMLPISLLLTAGKPLIFDELIVPLAWATRENHARTLRIRWFRLLVRLSVPLYKRWLRACTLILTDTKAHARLSAELAGLSQKQYEVLPVGTDETLFKPAKLPRNKKFTVFFYGLKMTPLHGLEYILEAAIRLARTEPKISFTIVGGSAGTQTLIDEALQKDAHISYTLAVPFSELASMMQAADLCLGGPFGDTEQARSVVTGKTYQALACARPTIVADTESYNEFTDGVNCLMVPLGDTNTLVDKIMWAYKHPTELHNIGMAGRILFENEFSTVHLANKLHQVITDAI